MHSQKENFILPSHLLHQFASTLHYSNTTEDEVHEEQLPSEITLNCSNFVDERSP